MASRNRTAPPPTPAAAPRGGLKISAVVRDSRGSNRPIAMGYDALFRREIAAIQKGKIPTLGLRKTADGSIERITRFEPRFNDRRSARSIALSRFDISGQAFAMLPADIAGQWANLKRIAVHDSRDEIERAEDQFCDSLQARADEISRDLASKNLAPTVLAPNDLGLYFLASTLAALQRVIEVRYSLPTILGVLPNTDYGTWLFTYTDTFEAEYTQRSEPSAKDGGGLGAGVQLERDTVDGALRPIRMTWKIDNQDLERHREVQGQDGAPEWDLMDRSITAATAALLADHARYVAFGSAPGIIPPPGAMEIPGFLYSKAAVSLTLNDASGEVNYNNFGAFLEAQHAAANYSEGLKAGVAIFPPSLFSALSRQFVNSNGSTIGVMYAMLENLAGLDEIRIAREFEPLAAEQQNLQSKGDPDYLMNGGGINIGGVMKKAVAAIMDDPEVVTSITGHDIQVVDKGNNDGVWSGLVRLNTGGARVYQTDGVRLGYQP